MRYSHFEQLKPLCPVCRQSASPIDSPLRLVSVLSEQDEIVIEGVLNCSNLDCQYEFPIIDGIPIILVGLRDYVTNNILPVLKRTDLHPTTESLLGDCLGPNSTLDAMRYQLSCYAWDHYGPHDPQVDANSQLPGMTRLLLEKGISLCDIVPSGNRLDVGCSVGGMAFELASKSNDLVLGIDVNFSMLRLAQQVLRTGRVKYPLRRVGLVYDQREFSVNFERSENVDFWACDASALPFARSTFQLVSALNVVDCVTSPLEFLHSIAGMMANGSRLILSTPFDWSPNATPYEAWIGGHSQRGPDAGASEPLIRRLLQSGNHPQSMNGMNIIADENDVNWAVRVHDRATMHYRTHLIVAGKGDSSQSGQA